MSTLEIHRLPEWDDTHDRSRRSKRKRGSNREKGSHQSPTTVGGSDFGLPPKSINREMGEITIGSGLRREFAQNPALEESFEIAIQRLDNLLEGEDMEAFIEYDATDAAARPVLRTEIYVEDVDEWWERKQKIREVVRESEKDDIMIYTRVDKTQ